MASKEKDGIRRVEGKKGVSWQAKANAAGNKPVYQTFKSRTDAKHWKASVEAAMIERRYFAHSEGDRHTVKDMVDRYIETENPNQKRRQVLTWWVQAIGNQSLSLVTSALIIEQRDLLRKGITRFGKPRNPATVNRYLAYLSALFSIAVREWQWIQQNPLQGIKKLPEAKGRVRCLHKDEIMALVDKCKQSQCRQIYPFTLLALSSGARAGELLDLRCPT